MIIDTNGFEIGDKVWYIDSLTISHPIKYGLFISIIYGFEIYEDEIYVMLDEEGGIYDTILLSECFKIRKQAVDYCNKMNGVNNG